MSVTVRGNPGDGFTTVYEAPQGRAVTVQTLKFQVDTDGTAGAHTVRVRLVDPSVGSWATLDDLNAGGPNETHYYTFGLGLNASACTTSDGMAVTDALPWAELGANGSVTVSPTDGSDSIIGGDRISNVVLKIDDPQAEGADNTPMPLLVPEMV